jgi:hypothetical protein
MDSGGRGAQTPGGEAWPTAGQPWGPPPGPGDEQQPPPADATQVLPPYPAEGPGVPGYAPGPNPGYGPGPGEPQAPAEATQLLPPYPAAQPDLSGDHHTAVLRPVRADAIPPATPVHPHPHSQAPAPAPAPGGTGGYGYPQEPAPTAPPEEFDHLYRSDTPAPAAAPRTPRSGPAQQPYGAQQPPGGYQPPFEMSYEDPPERRRRLSPAAVIGIVVAGCAVLGLAAGALLSGGGGGGHPSAGPTSSASAGSSPGKASSSAAAADPAKAQAQKLSALLKTSGGSRSAVVTAVENVKECKQLGKSASDLRAAAKARGTLVTRLGRLDVSDLPNHQQLTDELTNAWKASASADNHYASWADQAGHKHGCRGGHARGTGQTQAGDRDSGTASTAKARAVKLWNAIADKYGLPERTAAQI